jgi:hypothetical protein
MTFLEKDTPNIQFLKLFPLLMVLSQPGLASSNYD